MNFSGWLDIRFCIVDRQRRSESASKIQRSILCMRWMLGDRSFLVVPPKAGVSAERLTV